MKVEPQIVEVFKHKMYIVCPNCNKAINIELIRSKVPNVCQECGAEFEWTIKKRGVEHDKDTRCQ